MRTLFFCFALVAIASHSSPIKPQALPDVKPLDAYTVKEHCIKKTIFMFKKHYLPWYAKTHFARLRQTARKITHPKSKQQMDRRLYNIVHFSSGVYKKTAEKHTPRTSPFRGLLSPTNARYIFSNSRRHPKKHRHFIKIMGSKRLLTRSLLRSKKTLKKNLQRIWRSLLSHRKSWLGHELVQFDSMSTVLAYSANLPKKYQTMLQKCALNLEPALNRCNQLYGQDSCEKVSATIVNRKCPPGTSRIGCCRCASVCPNSFFKEDGYYCKREKSYPVETFKSHKDCIDNNKYQCIQARTRFERKCRDGFSKVESNCKVECPLHWLEVKGKCRRPNLISLGTPLLWQKSDQ